MNPDRLDPTIYIIPRLDSEGLDPIVEDSRVIINGIGPYHRLGTPVVESCARNGTHYVDFSTETLWVAEVIYNYHEMTTISGATIILAISGYSVPSDLAP